MKIQSSDFSIIIQGPVLGKPDDEDEKQLTKKCIASVKNVLPGSEIIISTWINTDVSHLDYDKIVFNEDPGSISYNDYNLKNKFNNNNRQIVSTNNGLKVASRKFAIKLRGDCKLSHNGFIDFLSEYPNRGKYCFFDQRIITSNVFSLNPRKAPVLFHISDIFQVGLTSDMKQLWDIELQLEPQTTRAVQSGWIKWNDPYSEGGYEMKFASEQYIWFAFCKKYNLNLNLKFYSEIPLNKIVKSELSIINNFVIASPNELGFVLPDKMIEFLNYPLIYSSQEWIELYDKYCVKGISIFDKIELICKTILNSYKFRCIFLILKLKKLFKKA
ncbi:WavE lipopolysaccharide synthesis family protein [Flavobacterium johnsoniae]|uniref:WavE lipopolysaccharide synthesis family protein n=1 Tax=Flavobacterium johnsoniae TaxID=986 RepID=UPI0011ED8597|nr:WavE lipopolysaccharide synthesis family protein [Flavobacterium johnsoniae]